jgi:hypothetical protein
VRHNFNQSPRGGARTKPRISTILVCLFLGAALTLAGAWHAALYADLGRYTITYTPPAPGSRLSSASRVPDDFEQGTHVRRGSWKRSLRYELVTEMMWMGSRLGTLSDCENRSIERVSAGWPAPAMEWIGSLDTRHDDNAWRWHDGLTPPIHKGNLCQGADRRIPLTPIWPGFAINTLVLSLVPFSMWTGFFLLRRHRRRIRGTCADCGYDIFGLASCPECGERVDRTNSSGSRTTGT